MASFHILQETGGKLTLEDATGHLILETGLPGEDGDDDLWWIHAQQVQAAQQLKDAPRPRPLTGDGMLLFLNTDQWTLEELEFLLASDIFDL